ncbi:putative kynureninase [Myriangium duriaei CBS 260.36]|uniref:Kynureninase n=1 Tax=Myriangium duriaei CBS 260.36 TaxID=1168546 RepID=A0A9P4J7V2_9PEZI|nr:putative kynureninase [Myriangium duriaei CBS 260.36]
MDVFNDDYAEQQDSIDPLRELRSHFHIPTRGQLKRTALESLGQPLTHSDIEPSTYLCGNSLGLQPKLVTKYTAAYHETWATKGVYGHFKEIDDSPLVPWLHVDDDVAEDMGNLIGGSKSETAVMQTLTANIHLALASFYRPTKDRYKIIIEGKAFPSDHYAIESQLRQHGHDPATSLITIDPTCPTQPTLTTSHILSVIDEHASSTAVLHLPAIQFYTGQLFDIPRITAHAHAAGIVVGWDLAHAVGNVPLSLHSWNVDYAVWCSYKYLNCGPGSIGGLFVHERHATPNTPRLAGWWGSSKTSRFAMTNSFEAIPGAAGWQLSNPSVADLTAMRASLDTFKLTSMKALREKSVKLTQYLQNLLVRLIDDDGGRAFEIITPLDPGQRGAQLSLRLAPGLLDGVMKVLEEEGVVVDERRPDVIRVAPAPLYNTFKDVLRFVEVFEVACRKAREGDGKKGGAVIVDGGKGEKGWGNIK